MTARYQVKYLAPDNLENVVYNILKRVVDVHPVLGITIANEFSPKPSFAQLTEIDLGRIVHFTGRTDIRATIEDAHQNPFECGDLPLWRLIVSRPVNEFMYVSFFFHHGICDGTSGVAFHHAFLNALNDALETLDVHESQDTLIAVPRLELLPSLEQAHALPVSPWYVIGELIKSWRETGRKFWTGAPIFPTPNITCLRLAFLRNSQITAITQRCRDSGVTFTALLTVLIARILAKCLPHVSRFNCQTAMSFRRFTGTDQKAMVCYVSSFGHRFSSSSQSNYIQCGAFSWDAVKACHHEIKAATSNSRNHKVGLLRFVNNYEEFFWKQVGKPRATSFEVSNVGVMDAEQGRASIDHMIFSQSSNVTGAALVFSIASAKGGDLVVSLTWQKGVVEEELAENVLKALEGELGSFAGSLLN